MSWYRNPGVIVIPWEEFLEKLIRITYGDLFPTIYLCPFCAVTLLI